MKAMDEWVDNLADLADRFDLVAPEGSGLVGGLYANRTVYRCRMCKSKIMARSLET